MAKLLNRVFIFNGIQWNKYQTLYFWIQLIGSPDEAKNYCYVLKLDGNKPHICIAYYGEVNSINESPNEIMKSSKCFTISFESLKAQFVNEKRRYKFSLGIRKLTK